MSDGGEIGNRIGRTTIAGSVLSLVAGLLLLIGCAVNPATGKRQLSFYSESDEIELGREADQGLVEQLGLYPDDDLQRYVQELGEKLAARSERPDLPWTFRVVDDPIVNAFALPGGYIYITRGILSYINSEAELAGVIGHEIGHVTARHGVNQMSKAQLTQYGLALGNAASEDFANWSGVAGQGLGLLFLKYSRDDERQSDQLGLRYLLRAGYDPRPMADLYGTLKAVSSSEGAGRVPSLLSTHPDPGNRRETILSSISEQDLDLDSRPKNRKRYLRTIDGIVFGDDPRQGFFRDGLFLHPEMRFQLRFPDGWQTVNARSAVIGKSADGESVVQLTLVAGGSAPQAATRFFEAEGVQRGEPWVDEVHGLKSVSHNFTADGDTTIRGRVVFVEYDGRVIQLLGMAVADSWAGSAKELSRSLRSFDRLTDPEALAVEPRRLRVVQAEGATNLERLANRHQATVPLNSLALLNSVSATSQLVDKRDYKVVVGGP